MSRLCSHVYLFPGRCSKMLRAAWTWMGSFLLSTARTAAKSPLMTSSSCWLTSGSESSALFCYFSESLVTVAQNTHVRARLVFCWMCISNGIASNTTFVPTRDLTHPVKKALHFDKSLLQTWLHFVSYFKSLSSSDLRRASFRQSLDSWMSPLSVSHLTSQVCFHF